MSALKGTNIAAPLAPFDSADVYPTHDEQYGKGGYRTVADDTARDAIPTKRRTAGMLVYVTGDNVTYQLAGDLATWNTFTPGGPRRYDLTIYIGGVITTGNAFVFRLLAVRNFKLVATLTSSLFAVRVNPTATTTFTLLKNGSSIGSVAFSTGGVPTVTFVADVSFTAGDFFEVQAQASPDVTAADFSFSFVGTPLP